MDCVKSRKRAKLDGTDFAWRKAHRLHRANIGLSLEAMPWSDAGGQCHGTACDRQVDYINIAAAYHRNALTEGASLYLDISQGLTRHDKTTSKIMGSTCLSCATTSTKLFDFKNDSFIATRSFYHLMGYTGTDFNDANHGDASLRNRIGEVMYCGSLGIILEAFFLNPDADWW